ncbi:MAG: hypothetical protein ACRECO_18770 [Xanthobacteraceae bacterium]
MADILADILFRGAVEAKVLVEARLPRRSVCPGKANASPPAGFDFF